MTPVETDRRCTATEFPEVAEQPEMWRHSATVATHTVLLQYTLFSHFNIHAWRMLKLWLAVNDSRVGDMWLRR